MSFSPRDPPKTVSNIGYAKADPINRGTRMVARYFAYGSNMNPDRVRERGIQFSIAVPATYSGVRLAFDKASDKHMGVGHANVVYDPAGTVEGVLYELTSTEEIIKMDRFESTPRNYSREIVHVSTAQGDLAAWTYFANPGVRRAGLIPPRSYLEHLLAAEPFLSAVYFAKLSDWPCEEGR